LPTAATRTPAPYIIRNAGGANVTVSCLPVRSPSSWSAFIGSEGQRLDGIAAHYLTDATAFWQLCDASGALTPDALAARDLIAVR